MDMAVQHMTWPGTAMVWSVAGAIPRSRPIGSVGFDKAANPNTTATLQEALNDIAALPGTPYWRSGPSRRVPSIRGGSQDEHRGPQQRRQRPPSLPEMHRRKEAWDYSR
jgi:hypothetical protein